MKANAKYYNIFTTRRSFHVYFHQSGFSKVNKNTYTKNISRHFLLV